MTYSHYAMISNAGAVIMGMFPQYMKAGMKAFSGPMSTIMIDLETLEQHFPTGPNRMWVAVNQDGCFCQGPCNSSDWDLGKLRKHSKDIYAMCDHTLPQLHKYLPFIMKYLNTHTSSIVFDPYKTWEGVTKAYLTAQSIPITMEAPEPPT